MKIAKLSLVAAVAVAGLSTANAQPLEEAIKNVDVSGTVVYRYNDTGYEKDAVADTTNNYYKIGVSLKSKVTDDVTFNARVVADEDSTLGDNNGLVNLDSSTTADRNLNTEITNANFAYTGIANTTVVVGKQGLQTPWTNAIDSDGSEQSGTGALALTTMGPVTAGAGYFNQQNITTKGENLTVGALVVNVAPAKLEAWYLDISENFNQYVVKGSASVGPVTAYAQYSDQDTDGATVNDDINLTKAGISGKLDIFDAGFTYAKGGKDGTGIKNTLATHVSATGYNVALKDTDKDADAYFIDLGAQVLPKLHIGLNYDSKDLANTDTGDQQELYVQATYAHSKNLSAYVRLADGEINKATDYNAGRLQVEYKF